MVDYILELPGPTPEQLNLNLWVEGYCFRNAPGDVLQVENLPRWFSKI